jgi:uncharacterized protein YebE (UPF0316 family)
VFDLIPAAWIPAVIFIARICDVSLGTLRIVFVSKGMRLRATLLGFVEVLIWIIVVAQLITQLDNWLNYIAYAGGFSAGTFLGMWIEDKLKVGTLIIRIITAEDVDELVENLKDSGFMLTRVGAEGGIGPVEIVFTIVKRKRWEEMKEIIHTFDPDAFYSVEEIRYASAKDGKISPVSNGRVFDRLLRVRKGI